MAASSDVPTDLVFVDPDEVVPTWRVGLWAEPGQGKSVAAGTAPDPIIVVSADRPTAYMYVRKHHARHWEDPQTGERVAEGTDGAIEVPAKVIRETRFVNWDSMLAVGRYIRDRAGTPDAIATVVIDPLSNIYDWLVDHAPKVRRKDEGEQPDYQWVNSQILGFIKALRPYDVNVVLIAHVKEPKKGAQMIGPNFGGPALSEKVMRELDIVAHVELRQLPAKDPDDESEEPRFMAVGQVQTLDTNYICKDGTGAIGARRVLNLSRWFDLAAEKLGPDQDDLPWAPMKAGDTPPGQDAAPDDLPAGPAPGTVAMPDLTTIKTRAGAKKALAAAGCICDDPITGDNASCPLADHGIPDEDDPDEDPLPDEDRLTQQPLSNANEEK